MAGTRPEAISEYCQSAPSSGQQLPEELTQELARYCIKTVAERTDDGFWWLTAHEVAMAENKTVQTDAGVDDYLVAITNESRRTDCLQLIRLMTTIAKQPARMWGTSIVGFGSYHYRYASGREGDSALVGFSSRKPDISIYLSCNLESEANLLSRLGKHKIGKGCLYLRRLSDVDAAVLGQLVSSSIAQTRLLYPDGLA